MILLTPQDWSLLSEETKTEIIGLMSNRHQENSPIDFLHTDCGSSPLINIEEDENRFSVPPEYDTWFEEPISSNQGKKKVVLEIDEVQASELISNLSDKSIQTLKLFTEDTPVSIDTLIGKDSPYNNFVELKRSFVGPVNRRLRTVSKNKSAVLFLKAGGEDENIQIAVKSGTQRALRKALLAVE